MPDYVIEKSIPGLGQLSPFQRDQTIRRGCSTLHGVVPEVEWVQSYLTEDKCYCVFRAPSEQVLWDLIDRWELERPVSISEIKQVADPNNENEASSRPSASAGGADRRR